MPTTPGSAERKRVMFRLDDATIARLDALAASTPAVNKSTHFRIAIVEYLDRQDQNTHSPGRTIPR
jgi:predicted transcriptional regulator